MLGDPLALPHPVSAIGAVIARVDRSRRPASPAIELATGAALTLGLTAAAAFAGTLAARRAPLRLVLGASTLAARSLFDAVAAVERPLCRGDLPAARAALARIVGRDTDGLDEAEISRAAIETLAESFADGVVAPLVALRLGGVGAALAFKAISTLDSMIGHREPPHTFFGRVAARADDVANLIPARIAALAIVVAAALSGEDATGAMRAVRADASRHRSPNAGWPESAIAGALDVRLGGTNRYDGVAVAGAVLHATGAPPGAADLRRARRVVARATALVATAFVFS